MTSTERTTMADETQSTPNGPQLPEGLKESQDRFAPQSKTRWSTPPR